MNFITIEGLVSVFQNGMTIDIPIKIELFIATWLRSSIFVKKLTKTLEITDIWVTLDRNYLILRSKTKLKKLPLI